VIPRTPCLSLFCLEQDRRYQLKLEGEDWSESFPSIEAAVMRAPSLVSVETKMTVYGVDGAPLVVATGAAQISRRAVGTAVFGGMLAASSIGIFLVPMLYMTFQRIRESAKRRFGGSGEKPHSPAGPSANKV